MSPSPENLVAKISPVHAEIVGLIKREREREKERKDQ